MEDLETWPVLSSSDCNHPQVLVRVRSSPELDEKIKQCSTPKRGGRQVQREKKKKKLK